MAYFSAPLCTESKCPLKTRDKQNLSGIAGKKTKSKADFCGSFFESGWKVKLCRQLNFFDNSVEKGLKNGRVNISFVISALIPFKTMMRDKNLFPTNNCKHRRP